MTKKVDLKMKKVSLVARVEHVVRIDVFAVHDPCQGLGVYSYSIAINHFLQGDDTWSGMTYLIPLN